MLGGCARKNFPSRTDPADVGSTFGRRQRAIPSVGRADVPELAGGQWRAPGRHRCAALGGGGVTKGVGQVTSAFTASSQTDLFRRLPNLFKRNTLWTTAIYVEARDFEPGDPLTGAPVYRFDTKRLLRGRRDIFTRADPFVWVEDDKLFVFLEAEPEIGDGRIEGWVSDDLRNFHSVGTVLREPFHLSYPFVFGDGAKRYMIPKLSAGNGVSLYEFEAFPTGLKHRRKLLDGCYVDSSVIEIDGIWYLFTTSTAGLEIYFMTDLLDGAPEPHPQNPVVTDRKFSRCGGGVLRGRNGLVRLAQDCSEGYGDNLNLLAIDELSPDSYSERLVEEHFIDRKYAWNSLGAHHLSLARFRGKTVVAVDGRQSDFYLHRLRGLVYRALGL